MFKQCIVLIKKNTFFSQDTIAVSIKLQTKSSTKIGDGKKISIASRDSTNSKFKLNYCTLKLLLDLESLEFVLLWTKNKMLSHFQFFFRKNLGSSLSKTGRFFLRFWLCFVIQKAQLNHIEKMHPFVILMHS